MIGLSEAEISQLLTPYFDGHPPPQSICLATATHLELLKRWNAKMNLTAIRDSDVAVQRLFGESYFLARHLPPGQTVLDIGSGAGFPGLPIALLDPTRRVTLAEGQGRKASFLREVAAALQTTVEVYGKRVETLDATRGFDIVALKAVDRMQKVLEDAQVRVKMAGFLIYFKGTDRTLPAPNGFKVVDEIAVPQSEGSVRVLIKN